MLFNNACLAVHVRAKTPLLHAAMTRVNDTAHGAFRMKGSSAPALQTEHLIQVLVAVFVGPSLKRVLLQIYLIQQRQ